MRQTAVSITVAITSFTVIMTIIMTIPNQVSGQSADTIDAVYGTAPTTDGIISPGEWDDADSVKIQTQSGNSIDIFYKHDSTNLYVAFDTNSDYYAEIYFDTSLNGGLRPQSDDLLLHASGALYEQQGTGYDWGDSNYEITGWSANTMYEEDGKLEFAISFSKIGIIPDISSILGISFGLTETATQFYHFYWPDDSNSKNPNTWGELTSSDNWGSGTNQPPIATASADKKSGTTPLTVSFTGSGFDSDGVIESYYWEFGDSSHSSEQNPIHIFENAGIYEVILTVTDDDESEGTDKITITVTEKSNGDDKPDEPSNEDKEHENETKKDGEEGLPGFEVLPLLGGMLGAILIIRKKRGYKYI